MTKRLALFFVALLFTGTVVAQKSLSRSELGLAGGGMNYIGDLNGQSMFGKVNLAGGLTARYNFDTRWSLALCGTYGHIEGGNPDIIARRNLSFRSYIVEGCIRAEFNFFPYGVDNRTQKAFTPFIFCGLGLFGFNPKALYADTITGEPTWYDLQPLATEGQGTQAYPDRQRYKLLDVYMPFGIGLRWRLSPAVHLSAEYGWRKTWNDYLDDVSTTYVGTDVLMAEDGGGAMAVRLADRSSEVQPGYVNAVGIKRGDDSLPDWYAYFNISLTFSMELLFGWMRGKVCEQ